MKQALEEQGSGGEMGCESMGGLAKFGLMKLTCALVKDEECAVPFADLSEM